MAAVIDGNCVHLALKAHQRLRVVRHHAAVSVLTSPLCFGSQMPVAVGPYGQTQPSCFDRVKMGFMMGFAVGMAAGAMLGTFSCLR